MVFCTGSFLTTHAKFLFFHNLLSKHLQTGVFLIINNRKSWGHQCAIKMANVSRAKFYVPNCLDLWQTILFIVFPVNKWNWPELSIWNASSCFSTDHSIPVIYCNWIELTRSIHLQLLPGFNVLGRTHKKSVCRSIERDQRLLNWQLKLFWNHFCNA